jgi:hypothetical protein
VAGGTAWAKGPDPTGPAKYGLCQAWSHQHGKGAHHKRDAVAFKALIQAAGGVGNVTAFCTDATPGGEATTGDESSIQDSSQGTPPTRVGGSGTADAKSHNGASTNGTTTATDKSGGHSSAGSDNAAGHRP